MMPRSAQSSLSHCTTIRPGIEAGSSGTISSSRPRAMIIPPECCPRWRGSPAICWQSCRYNPTRRSPAASPASRARFCSESKSVVNSNCGSSLEIRSSSSCGSPSTLPISREADRAR